MEPKLPDSKGKLIFFVDDDKLILNLLEYTFKSRDDYEVKSFPSGEECLAALNENPDIIVLDHIFLKNGESLTSGLEILKKLRERGYGLPVIVLSNQQDDNLIPEFLKYGAFRYIQKDSYFIDTLIETIEEAMTEVN
jgi:two-component system, OmpR family, response regulator